MLKQFDSPINTPIQTPDISTPETNKSQSQESPEQIQEQQDEHPSFLDYLIGLTLPRMQIPLSSKPSVPSATPPPSSPSESPPPSNVELTEQQIRERSRSRDSIKSSEKKNKK